MSIHEITTLVNGADGMPSASQIARELVGAIDDIPSGLRNSERNPPAERTMVKGVIMVTIIINRLVCK
jgi:hypothetical protein